MTFKELYSVSNEEIRYQLDERAAIHEFDGGASREDAERMAAEEIIKHRDQLINQDMKTKTPKSPTGKCAECGKQLALGTDGSCKNGHELCWNCWCEANHTCPVCERSYDRQTRQQTGL